MQSSANGALGYPNPGSNAVKKAVNDYLEHSLSGRSQDTIGHVLTEWVDHFGLESFDEIDRQQCREYGRYLSGEVKRNDRELEAPTAHTYYAYVRAFLSFCVRDERLERNPALTEDADEYLPQITSKPDRQFWTPEERETAIRFCSKQVDSALTPPMAPEEIRLKRYRDRAIVTILGLTGVRGAEVFAVPRDDRRNGITWDDVDTQENSITVLGKVKREDKDPYQSAQLPTRAATALERYKAQLDPPTDAWPVVPTNHYPSKRKALEVEFSEARVDSMLRRASIDELLREHEVPPPSISTNGARTILKRLSARLDVAYDHLEYDPEEGDYLKPHGARRGLGDELYRKGHAEVAQKSLRHTSLDVTDESYQNIKTKETARQVDDLLKSGE